MAPAVVGTRWVALVAQVAATLEPSGVWSWLGWVVVVVLLVVAIRHRSRVERRRVPI
jgi:hypothetical protein